MEIRKIWNPKYFNESTKTILYCEQIGWRGALLSYRRDSVVINIKHKSDALELFTVGNDDLLAGLAISEPTALHDFHNVHDLFHLPKDHRLAIQALSIGDYLCLVQHLSWARCQDLCDS